MTYTENIQKIDLDLNIEINLINEKYQRSIDLWKEIYKINYKTCDQFYKEAFASKEKIEEGKKKAEKEAKRKAKEEALNYLEALIQSF